MESSEQASVIILVTRSFPVDFEKTSDLSTGALETHKVLLATVERVRKSVTSSKGTRETSVALVLPVKI